MQEHMEEKGALSRAWNTVWVTFEYIAVHTSEALIENMRIMREESDLFLGAALTLLGLLNWSSSKYCDGNTADYLSCTRPATYYYYGAFEIFLIVVGTLFVLVWFIKNRHSK